MSIERFNQPEAGWSNKIHSQHNVPTIKDNSPACDVWKAQVEATVPATHEKSVVGASLTSGVTKRGTFTQNNAPDSDKSTVAAIEDKDDFPEGGLRAWLVAVGAFCVR